MSRRCSLIFCSGSTTRSSGWRRISMRSIWKPKPSRAAARDGFGFHIERMLIRRQPLERVVLPEQKISEQRRLIVRLGLPRFTGQGGFNGGPLVQQTGFALADHAVENAEISD